MARTLRAVLIDDNPVVCRAIEAAVDWEGLGCRVAGSAYDGNDGLRLIRAQCPELIITDIRMPGRDGLEMVQEIRSLLPHSRILIITGYPDFSYAQRAIGLGVFSLTLKPIDYAALTQEIAKAAKALRREMEQAAEQSSRQHEISYLNKEVHARRRENACAAVEPYLLDPSKKPPLKAIQELGLDRLSFQLCCGRQSISPEETLLCAKRLSTVEPLLSDMSYHSGKNCEIFIIPYPALPPTPMAPTCFIPASGPQTPILSWRTAVFQRAGAACRKFMPPFKGIWKRPFSGAAGLISAATCPGAPALSRTRKFFGWRRGPCTG